jgi:hypothetical protein
MWAHQYDQQSNQVIVNGDERAWSTNKNYSNIYGLMPNFACCLANMHQGWPKFSESLWMATNDNGLIAVAYAPSIVSARVGKNMDVTISEVTDYPFKGTVSLIINTDRSVRFPLYLRIPGWADNSEISYKNSKLNGKAGSTVKIYARWDPGDTIVLRFPMKVRTEKRYNNSIALLRGPLYFSLRMDKDYKSVKINYDNFGYKGSTDWEIYPKSPWNYGLVIDRNNLDRGIEVIENEITAYPFADKGDMIWSADSARYLPWEKDAPVVITTRGMRIPDWTLKNNSADLPPPSPVAPNNGVPEIIQLVPYGNARLRITEFPLIDITRIVDVIR